MTSRPIRPLTLLAALTTVLAVSACGGSSNASGGTATVTVVRTTTAGGPTATTSTATTPTATTKPGATGTGQTTTTRAASGPPACVAADLAPLYLGANGTAGTIYYGFALRNTSGHPCHTYGYPGVAFVSPGGAMLPTKVKRKSIQLAGSVLITLRSGQEASFRVAAGEGFKGGAECKPASSLQIIAPDDTTRMQVPLRNGAQACGEATVSQLLPGRAAFAG